MNYKMISLLLLAGFSVSMYSSEVVTELNSGAERWYRPVNKEDLLSHVDDNPQVKQCARSIVERCYEREMRALVTKDGKNKYGSEFPLYPEVMAPYLKTAKGRKVLEIAAGHGENGLLFALAGAEDVFINDIVQEQFIPLEKDVATLPESYQHRIHMLPGDCFDLMHNKELQQGCDLIIARNIVHFFTPEKRELFFTMVAKLLKPGGTVILSVNTPFLVAPRELINKHPDTTAFYRIILEHAVPGQQKKAFTSGEVAVANSQEDPLVYTFSPLITFGSGGIEKHPSLVRFSPKAQEEILRYQLLPLRKNHIPTSRVTRMVLF